MEVHLNAMHDIIWRIIPFSWEPKGTRVPFLCHPPQEIAGLIKFGLIKGNQRLIVPDHKALLGGWHRGGGPLRFP